jgi:hypothetical protein
MKTMKSLILFSFLIFLCTATFGQSLRSLDKSPADIAYLPDNFAHDRKVGEKAIAKVVYSRPQKNDREIFGGVVPFGKVWRTGANENSEIRFYQDVKFGGSSVKAGTYSLFSIPDKESWTIILNSDTDYWGAFSYKEENDILRTRVTPSDTPETVEAFIIQFEMLEGKKAVMKIAWDNVLVNVPIEY